MKVKKIKELGGYFRLTEDQMWHIRDSQHPTTEAFIAAKVNNRELRWKDIVQALLSIDECKQLGLVYSEQGWFIRFFLVPNYLYNNEYMVTMMKFFCSVWTRRWPKCVHPQSGMH